MAEAVQSSASPPFSSRCIFTLLFFRQGFFTSGTTLAAEIDFVCYFPLNRSRKPTTSITSSQRQHTSSAHLPSTGSIPHPPSCQQSWTRPLPPPHKRNLRPHLPSPARRLRPLGLVHSRFYSRLYPDWLAWSLLVLRMLQRAEEEEEKAGRSGEAESGLLE